MPENKKQEYAEKTPPEKIARNQKFAKWLVAGLGIVGGLIPLIKCKGNGVV